ncbi:tail fiber protein [Neolewinella lacunae]|uniref:Phage tail protein n=1 Tax=Neolewinella lacunae TaxID=1517758 RepID=A0A923PJR3_9BACT|nr:tail fiber protein [Neolewinella lacunae]MBC6994604.1 phage tail protein [Neolewinella lacunae]MDN3634476.1 tail fiber protein [Neolewinella lacunae]
MATPILGEIRQFGFNFAPRGWAFCNGQLMSIAQNNALFALLGTIYGGDGRTTFALPDLRGRVAFTFGQGPGLSNYQQGARAGAETQTLLLTQLPGHTHGLTSGRVSIPASAEDANQDEASGHYLANGNFYHANPDAVYGGGPIPLSGSTDPTGGNQPHSLMQPYLVTNFCIAIQGIFPSRN